MWRKRKHPSENASQESYIPSNKRRYLTQEARPKFARDEYTVGWICAIATEYAAAQALLDEEHVYPHDLPRHDASHYTLGKIGPHNVVMAVLPEYGTSAATAVARDMQHSFPNVSIGLMVGIGGGAPTPKNDIRLGDIVVSTAQNGHSSVIQYDFGKAIQGQSFQQTGFLGQPLRRLRGAAVGLQARYKRDGHQIEEIINGVLDDYPNLRSGYARPSSNSDMLYRSSVVHPSTSEGACAEVCGHDPSKLVERPVRTGDKLVIHHGVIASANQVMKDAVTRDNLAAEHGVLCFEMEAAGLSNNFSCLVIRGICDYSDSHKNKAWQGYAAMAAAAYAKDLLHELSPLRSSLPTTTPAELRDSRVSVDRKILSDEQREKLLKSLTFDQIDARHKTIRRAHAKTCRWVLKSSQYIDWLDDSKRDEHHGFLWIKGKPGAGKSTLMKLLSSKYRKKMQQSTLITFFFNARGEHLEKSTIGMYRSLLFQLIDCLSQHRTNLDFPAFMIPNAWPREWTIESLKEIFEEAILNIKDSSITCFIDALDECDEDQIRDMVSFFERISEATTLQRVNFQVCFSSRHYPHITISKAVNLVLEGQQGHNNDIVNYVRAELKIGNSKIAQQIRNDLHAKASGVFMWVVLVVNILNKESDGGRIHQLRQRLREIPSDLNTLFRDILTRDRNHRDELLLCIQWVLFANVPLSPEELYFAILSGTELDSTEALSDWDPEDVTIDIMKRFILDSSKGLTEVTKSSTPTVQFIHESVRDFLLKNDGLSQILPEFGSNFRGLCHERLKHCCLNYLGGATAMEIGKTLAQDQAELRELAEKRTPFLRYATQQVLYHSDAAEASGVSQIAFLRTFNLADWIVLNNLVEKYKRRQHTPHASLLYVLARNNRANLINIERSKLECFKIEAGRYGAPILAALATRSSEAVHAFLTAHKESNPNGLALSDLQMQRYSQKPIPDDSTCGFLFYAERDLLSHVAELGDERVAALLLELGETDPDAVDHQLRAPLSYAAEKGKLAMVQFLVETGKVEIDRKDKDGLTPFCHASKHRHNAVVKWLFKTGRVNVDNQDKDGRTSLSFASEHGHDHLVKLLLESCKADVNLRDGQGRTPLSYAAFESMDAALRLLLESSNVDVDSRDNSGRTPLATAAYKGNTSVITLLVESGKVDVDSRDNSGRTPFSYTMKFSGNAKLFLETGQVEVDSRDNLGRTPLSYAAQDSSPETFKLLLQTGKVELDSKDNLGRTPLSYAATSSFQEKTRTLLETGKVEVDSRDNSGRTPLSYAAEKHKVEAVSLLLDKGQANSALEDNNGRTPLFHAIENMAFYDIDKEFVTKLLHSKV